MRMDQCLLLSNFYFLKASLIWITTTKYQKYLEQNMNYYITSQQTIYKSWYLQTKLRLMQSMSL